MEIKHLESFVAVVKHGSFTKAAEQLYVSQPTVSAHISALEEELKQELILRTTKSVEVTPKGSEVYDYAVNILELCSRLVSSCREKTGCTIHLGTSTIPSTCILPEILPSYAKKYPETYFVIHQSDSQGVIDGLLDGIFDIGFIGMKDDRLYCRPLWKDRMVIITPAREPFLTMKKAESAPLEELLKEPIILREEGSGSNKSAAGFLEMIGKQESELRIAACINDQETIKKLVENGLGISIISEKTAENYVKEGRLLQFDLPAYNERELYLAYRKNCVLKSQTLEFIEFIGGGTSYDR